MIKYTTSIVCDVQGCGQTIWWPHSMANKKWIEDIAKTNGWKVDPKIRGNLALCPAHHDAKVK